MTPTTTIAIPSRLNVRLRDGEKAAVAAVIAAISTPHRRPATVTEAIRAALRIAAEVAEGRRDAQAAPGNPAAHI